VIQQCVQHGRPRAPATRFGNRGHPAHPPPTGFALGTDQAHRHQLAAVERADGKRLARLGIAELLDRLMRAQDRVTKRAGLLERDLAD
jgi:hypothetical protein